MSRAIIGTLPAFTWEADRMEKCDKVSNKLQRMLDKAEELGWSYTVYEEQGQNNRMYVELENYSPAGEDFIMTVGFDIENQVATFIDDLRSYYENFDPDEHAEMWIPSMGKGGCPSSIRRLIEDADAIDEMIKELLDAMESVLYLEISDEQSARCDEIYNAVYEMCKCFTENENLEWDMAYIGEIAEFAANTLVLHGEKVRFPAVVTNQDGSQYIEEFYDPEGDE